MHKIRLIAIVLAAFTALGTLADAQTAPERSITEIADGVYRARNNFHGTVFMVTPEGIVLADPLTTDFAEWLRAVFDS